MNRVADWDKCVGILSRREQVGTSQSEVRLYNNIIIYTRSVCFCSMYVIDLSQHPLIGNVLLELANNNIIIQGVCVFVQCMVRLRG